MAENSKIAWTHHTFNPWRGCEHATQPDGTPHPGCEHCYAEAMSKRNPGLLGIWGGGGTRVMAAPRQWALPDKWDSKCEAAERRRVFCASLADVFEDWQGPIYNHAGNVMIRWHNGNYAAWPEPPKQNPWNGSEWRLMAMDDLRRDLFALIDRTPYLDWLVLTKRPENVRQMWLNGFGVENPAFSFRWNCWLGTSISDQKTADHYTAELLKLRDLVPVLFLSLEPMLGPVDVTPYIPHKFNREPDCEHCEMCVGRDGWQNTRPDNHGPFVDWVIIGCESAGPRTGRLSIDGQATEAEWLAWAVSLVRQCRAASVPCFVKQIPSGGRVLHDPETFPVGLQVREFPVPRKDSQKHAGALAENE